MRGEPVSVGFAPSLPVILAFTVVIGGGAIAAAHVFKAKPGAVHTSARIACPPPSEYETRLLYVNADAGGGIRIECGPAVAGNSRERRR